MSVMAHVIAHHGDTYWPIYERLEKELKRLKSRRKKLKRHSRSIDNE